MVRMPETGRGFAEMYSSVSEWVLTGALAMPVAVKFALEILVAATMTV